MLRLATLILLISVCGKLFGQGLQVTFGGHGLEKLSYRGLVLEDTTRWPEDQFHIWHVKCFDAAGKVRSDGEYGWGEKSTSRHWDAGSRTWIYGFVWGSMQVTYEVHQDALLIRVRTTNRAGSGVTLDGATIYPATLHLERVASVDGIVDGSEQPVVALAKWLNGVARVVSTDSVFAGFEAPHNDAYAIVVSGTPPDSRPDARMLSGRPVLPGHEDSFSIAVRFGTTPDGDILSGWRSQHAPKLTWMDRRIIGTVYLASSGPGDMTHPSGFPGNPRRYFNDPSVNIQTAAGLRQFQERILQLAGEIAVNLRRLGAQGVITWDLEGEEYPQNTSYVCSPDQISKVAPEMETVVEEGLAHAGMKLDDAYFRIIHDAGFKVGMCVRPQHFSVSADGSARQEFLPQNKVVSELVQKMRYAHDRWGVTLFYLDSTVSDGGWTLPSSVVEAAAAALPDCLLIPEESHPRMYGASAPFQSFLFHQDVGTSSLIRSIYPRAFSAVLINDANPDRLAERSKELTDSVRHGDILMVHADYWQGNNSTVMKIYRDAQGPQR